MEKILSLFEKGIDTPPVRHGVEAIFKRG